jgi:CheY-like chemotaxis protein
MPSSSPVRVLLAEDDEDVRAVLCEGLRAKGFMVKAVHDGEQAIRTFRRHDFDIVLTDMAMPGYDGLQVAKACKRQRPAVKVIVLTAWDPLLDDQECIQHGVDLLLPKPFEVETVAQALHQVQSAPRFQRSSRTSA